MLEKIAKFPSLPIHLGTLFTRYPPLNYGKLIIFLAQLIMTKVYCLLWLNQQLKKVVALDLTCNAYLATLKIKPFTKKINHFLGYRSEPGNLFELFLSKLFFV